MGHPVTLHPAVVSVTRIEIFVRGHNIGSASGFFYENRGNKYLITNRHVVIHEKQGIYPDLLKIRVHTNPNSAIDNRYIEIPLYDNNEKKWLEHHNEEIDVVAIRINTLLNDGDFIHFWTDATFLPEENSLMIGERTLVLGYPLGFYDEMHNLPIVKGGIIASPYRAHFEGNRYFLIDTNLQPGTSGSPVLSAPGIILLERDGFLMNMDEIYLIGIHSAGHTELGLNIVWYVDLIPEILSQ